MKSFQVLGICLKRAKGFRCSPFRMVDMNYSGTLLPSPDQAAELLRNVEPFILDLRIKEEYEQIHIEGTHLIAIEELQNRLGELESQKHKDIFVYCATGKRPAVAA